MLSDEELILILKKALPKSNYQDLKDVVKSIRNETKNWQEADLHQHIHDEVETQILHDICQRSNGGRKPKLMRLFFKE